jgi:hypothetical protein
MQCLTDEEREQRHYDKHYAQWKRECPPLASAHSLRKDGAACGPEGKLFEPKKIPEPGLLSRFFNFLGGGY